MIYEVRVTKRVLKKLSSLPEPIQLKLDALVADLESFGPAQPNWPNYSGLSKTTYHCHLGYRYVACWRHEKRTVIVEVYYVGSREKAPY